MLKADEIMSDTSQSGLQVHSFTPTHVPPALVRPFSFVTGPGMSRCPFAAVAQLHDGPRIFWNPANHRFGGSWVLTRAVDIRYVLGNTDLFSSKGQSGLAKLIGENWDLVPLELDPPLHGQFRKLLNPLLAPPLINKMTEGITSRAVELIDGVRAAGGCEFMTAFGQPFPVSIFMQLMGLPAELMSTFLAWELDLLHGDTLEKRQGAAREIRDYLLRLARERRAAPVDDLTSAIVTGEVEGRKLTGDEVLGGLYLLFVGGLDTVASTLGFLFRHLAQGEEHQRQLRAEPATIERRTEELLRRFSVVTSHRQCKVDVEIAGVAMKAGDWITINGALGGLDGNEFAQPLEVDMDRKAIRHFAFNFGPHFCVGSHLARREILVAIREWLARIPPWRLNPKVEVVTHGGGVFGVERLAIEW